MREAWSLRASWTGYSTAQQLQGLEIDEADTFSWAIGVALPHRPLRPSVDDPFDGFSAWRQALDAKGRHWREDLPFTVDLPDTWQDAPALCRALEITRQHARADRTARPWLQLPLLLSAAKVSVIVAVELTSALP
ncbi:MAG: hypothetical protein CVT77_03485 [Alphaproteobacteria bacterium HGW-Alphaproteobacteria-16]|nr:MAG: hypothetical protein CVT77_03485 [Alphaproteobacteria bacterium HGW-Alphaproteobacteria-16]